MLLVQSKSVFKAHCSEKTLQSRRDRADDMKWVKTLLLPSVANLSMGSRGPDIEAQAGNAAGG